MTQNFTVFSTFTVPVRKENFYNSIASTFFINEEHILPHLGNIEDRFGHSMFKHYTLIVVEEINPDPTVNREQEPCVNLKTISVTPEEFFNPTRTIQYFARDLESQSNLIFMFRNTNWSSILVQFRRIGIVISGGPTVKRHMLSPIQVRLTEFLKCWFGFDIMKKIVESYYSEVKELRTGVKPVLDLTSEAVSSTIREQIGDKNDWLSNPPFDNINNINKNINKNIYNTWLIYSFETFIAYRSLQPGLHLLVGEALESFNNDVVLNTTEDVSISIQITLATEEKDNILLTNVETFQKIEFGQLLKHCNKILNLEAKQILVEYKEIKQVIIRYIISKNCEDNNNNNSSSNPFDINGQNRKLHTICNLKSTIKLSDKILASVYNTNTNINNFTPRNRNFHTSAVYNAEGVSNDNSLITINADPHWKYFEYKLYDDTLNQFDLEKSVLSFYETKLPWVSDNTPLLLQFKLRLIDGREEDISFILKFYRQETMRMMILLNGFYSLKDELLSQIKDSENKIKASHIIHKFKLLDSDDGLDDLVIIKDNNVNSDQFTKNKQISKYLERLNYTPFKPNRFNRDCWEYFSYLLKDHTITDYQIEQAIYEFYYTLLSEWKGERDAIIQFKLRLSNNKYMDLSFHLKFKNTDYNELKYLFVKFLSLKEHLIKDEKGNLRATHIVFKYMFNGSIYLNDPYFSNNKYNSKTYNPSSKTMEHKKEYHTLTSGNKLKNKLSVNLNLFNFTPLVNNHIRDFSSIAHKQTIYDKDSPVIKDLLNIIVTESIDTNTQLKIERYLRNQYRESLIIKHNKDLNKNKPINYNVVTGSLQKELFENEEDLLKLINNFKTNVINKNVKDKIDNQLIQKIILNSPNEFIISIIFGRLLKIFSNNGRLNQNTKSTNVYIDLGRELIEKYIYVLYLKSLNVIDPAKHIISLRYPLSRWKEDNSELTDILKDSTFQLRVGSLLVGWMIELRLLDNKVVTVSSIQKHNIVIIGEKLEKTLPKDISKVPLLRLPNRIPMIVPPKPYLRNVITGVETLGGYLLNDVEYTDGIVLENWRLAKSSLVLQDNIIYDMVNYTSSVAFKINTKVLDFILENYKKYNLIIDPDYIHPLSIKESLRKSEKVQLESFYSKRDLEKNILGLAEIFRIVPKFYMPIRLDYRGRINVMTEYLKYQGTELAKALLLFAEGEKVNTSDNLSINYLKIFGANSFGNKIEKLSFSDRVKWIDDNIYDIVNFENGILISKADDKLLFISFCFEYNDYLNALNNNLPYFITHLPIVLDATCNGFQHLSMLIGDLNLTKELNLAESSWDDKPKDFYTFVALKIRDFLGNELKRDDLSPEVRDSYLRLYQLDMAGQRKLVKKALMTLPYNASARSIVEYIKENFDKIKEDHYVLTNDHRVVFREIDFNSLRNALHIVLYKESPKLKQLLKYFREIVYISNKLRLPIPWNLPSGFGVQQQFHAIKRLKVKPYIFGKDLLNLNTVNKKEYDNNKQLMSLMPNLVHSLDAASLALLISYFFKESNSKNFYSVHDCFSVTCNNIQIIMNLLKVIYFNVYSKDKYLVVFDTDFLTSILKHYGKDCYDHENKVITIKDKDNKYLELTYPNVLDVISNEKLNIMESSYIIN